MEIIPSCAVQLQSDVHLLLELCALVIFALDAYKVGLPMSPAPLGLALVAQKYRNDY
jgi:hypothetical protein